MVSTAMRTVIAFFTVLTIALPVYSQIEFIRSNIVIFEDDFKQEKEGEFPSKWRLSSGSGTTAVYESENVLSFVTRRTEVRPFMDKQNFLPKSFTIEFDYLMNHRTQHHYMVQFYNSDNRRSATLDIRGRDYKLRIQGQRGDFQGDTFDSDNFQPGWRNFALSYNKNEFRVFYNGTMIINVPQFDADLSSFDIIGGRPSNSRPNSDAFIRNVIIAEGGMPLYERVMSEGSFVTNEIQFDVNMAVIKPESMGIIEQVAQMMIEYSDLKFSVEGHTDSDGNPDFNQKLSLRRAESVVKKLIELGISKDRLTAKGWGASRPIADNSTAEGKALNRRVEFIPL